jgi:hypothetical protein
MAFSVLYWTLVPAFFKAEAPESKTEEPVNKINKMYNSDGTIVIEKICLEGTLYFLAFDDYGRRGGISLAQALSPTGGGTVCTSNK